MYRILWKRKKFTPEEVDHKDTYKEAYTDALEYALSYKGDMQIFKAITKEEFPDLHLWTLMEQDQSDPAAFYRLIQEITYEEAYMQIINKVPCVPMVEPDSVPLPKIKPRGTINRFLSPMTGGITVGEGSDEYTYREKMDIWKDLTAKSKNNKEKE